MKILIVDDELLVRIGIKSCINWQEFGMEVVGEASDGISALEMLRSLAPDVMFLDIKMPNMDGIELLHVMKKDKLNCKVLILSGFDDVYHVKEAMRCGAVDYFHKPCMSPEDILNTLLEIKKQLDSENKSSNKTDDPEKVERNKSILREVFLKELVDGKITDTESFKSRNTEVGSKLHDKNFNCIVFNIKNFEDIQKRYVNSSNTLQNAVLNVINGVFSKQAGIEFFVYDNNTFTAITSFGNIISEKKVLEEINSILEVITDAARQFLNIEIVIGIGDLHKTFMGIGDTFNEAIKALKYKFFKKDRDIIHYRDINRNNNNTEALIFINSMIISMKGSLETHDYTAFRNNMELFVNFLEEQPCLNEEDVKKLFNAFLFLISEGKSYLDEIELFSRCKYLRELYEIWISIINEKQSAAKNLLKLENCSFLTKNIVSFIEKHYNDDISLNMLSKHFNVSPNYVSRLFREETGEALFSYINEVRVEKAKKLLKDIDLKIYEVSSRVGFKSPVHFNIVFNKCTGLTPKQYRDELRGG